MIKNKYLVSIIIPVYNTEKYIAETIESVIQQTYTNWELLIVDDCSIDNSREIVKRFEKKDRRIRLIESKINFGGPAKPRNIGIENSKGEYIAFLDADDIWMEDKLEKQIEYMIENNLEFSSTDFIEIDKKSKDMIKSLKTNFLSLFLTKKKNLKSLLWHNFIIQSSVIIKNTILKKFKYDEDKLLIAIEDYILWIELFINNINYGFLNDKLVKYRVLDVSAVDRNNQLKNRLRRNYAISKILYQYNDKDLLNIYYKIIMVKYFSGKIKK